jgi:hypothetical protein
MQEFTFKPTVGGETKPYTASPLLKINFSESITNVSVRGIDTSFNT